MIYTSETTEKNAAIFPDDIKMCFGIGLAATGKNIFFDRGMVKK